MSGDDTGEIAVDAEHRAAVLHAWEDDPDDWVFPAWAFWPVWILAFTLIGVGCALIWGYVSRSPFP